MTGIKTKTTTITTTIIIIFYSFQNPDAWAILGHVKYLVGDTETAKQCYERTLAFIADASEMHSIYLRLASIYLQEGRVGVLVIVIVIVTCVAWLR